MLTARLQDEASLQLPPLVDGAHQQANCWHPAELHWW